MQMGPSKSLFLRLAGSSSISVAEPPSRRAISVLVANFSSTNVISSSFSGQFSSRRYDEESRGVRVSVWLDLEKCHIPANANVFKVSQNITSAVRINGIKGPITITAFGDLLQLSRTNQEALFATGIRLTHIPQGIDRTLITDLMFWVTQNPPPAHIFLISSNRDFASLLHRLRMNNYNILLAGNEETIPGVLCSASSIMWDWNGLVSGENYTGKYFNHPPDGPYNSWYGHYRTPLLDPFAITKKESCTSVKTAEFRPVPREVVEQIGLVLSLYPKGALFTEVREQLSKRNVPLGKDFYGHKSFMRFLLSMRDILQVVRAEDGMFLVRACTQEMDNKASSTQLSSENPKAVSVEKMHQKVKRNVEDVKMESQSQESVPVISQTDVKAKDEPVKENQLALTTRDDVSSSKEKDGFLEKLNRLWFGSPEMELEHRQEKKRISGNGDEWEGVVSEGKVNGKADNEVGNGKSASPGMILSWFLKRFEFLWGRNTEAATETQVDDIFAKDSSWKDVESFINSPRGFVVVSHSRSRDALAKNLKDEGPSSLKPLDVSKMLDLVTLLVSEKKWIIETSSDALPFRVSRFTEKNSGLNHPRASSGLRSIITSMSKSQCDKSDDEKKLKKPLKRSRSEVMADCHNLIKKITEENPGGYNMSNFKKDFSAKFGYRLDYRSLGYTKLHSLIEMMPEARIESGYIVPSSTPAPYDSSASSDEELGPVSEKIREHEPSVSEEEGCEEKTKTKTEKGEETESDLLQILGSWDNAEDDKKKKNPAKSYVYGEDKLVDGILKSLAKKPSGESRISI